MIAASSSGVSVCGGKAITGMVGAFGCSSCDKNTPPLDLILPQGDRRSLGACVIRWTRRPNFGGTLTIVIGPPLRPHLVLPLREAGRRLLRLPIRQAPLTAVMAILAGSAG